MALFQKKFITQSSAPLYTLGANRTILVIGLGNPGRKYDGTRHNIGFGVLDDYAQNNSFPGWVAKKDLKNELTIHRLGQNRVILAKPQTFMNNSGEAAAAVQHFYRVHNKDSLAVYDELAIPFGSLRSRLGGSDAGHNGVKSLIGQLGDDFGRLRIGIGSDKPINADTAGFVLKKFTKQEQAGLPAIVREAGAMITEFIFSGQLPNDTRQVF